MSLTIAFGATIFCMTIGMLVGILAGYFGGLTERILMRVTEIVIAFPSLLLAITLAALFQPSLSLLFVVIGAVGWTSPARAIRAETRSLRTREFVLAARALGAGDGRVLRAHILPNLAPTIFALGALTASHALLIDAGLSFIGLGVPPPTPSWGRMLSESQSYYRSAPWLMVFPGLALTTAVLAFQLIASGMSRREGRVR